MNGKTRIAQKQILCINQPIVVVVIPQTDTTCSVLWSFMKFSSEERVNKNQPKIIAGEMRNNFTAG